MQHLQRMFYQHAAVYRAITIDEYRLGFANSLAVEKEFEAICSHWNLATQQVDMRAMAYTVELFEYISHIPYAVLVRSGCEYQPHQQQTELYPRIFTS